MKCKIEGCTNSEDLTFGELNYHLRDEHRLGSHEMLGYIIENVPELKKALKLSEGKETCPPRTETMILKIVFLPEEATREGLIHVLSEISGAIVEMEEIKNE